ncbi:MAG: pyridoxal phosphate-dependent aminotransferase [Mucilaginibacter sp.]|nr:pyridoxal phosphate-dependent aminotransferase [Mucilaginibacter sp.]
MNKKIWLSPPHMCGREMLYINKAFDTNYIAPLGSNVEGFEQDITAFLGDEYKVAVLSSGTAALHLSLILLNIKPGDEVICQSFTFSASANPILYQGATPVFVDSELNTWNMSPEFLEIAIKKGIEKGKKPKAIIIVHLYGMPAQMDKLMEIADNYNIPVVEDAAEALGSEFKGRKLGTFGKFGVISFNGNKIITTSGGGAIISQDAEMIAKAKFLASQARDPVPYFQHSSVGYNYRMSNICAGIGRGQMEALTLRIYQRRRNFLYYNRLLSVFPEIKFQEEPGQEYFSNRWLTAIVIDNNNFDVEDFRAYMEGQNIEIRHLWKPLHMQPIFANYAFYGDGTSEALFKKGLCLPSGSELNNLQLNRIIKEIRKAVELPLTI